jgi:predicted RNase H-like HicB family nuclease
MKEAIEFHIDGLKEEKLPISEPTNCARSVEVAI